ncbi:helix-turn-helix domain-containing protein [Ichthyenterobacterium magnum]|uniref:AraC-like DNA-binding protein n=1 Tax=Ichthyenterobacterium magnum TaxID=1230530 RepID=A0A420DL39_9FLAO|nr:helix-turn-helix domain-containing protein [Ichthyenterobacterium magnum]RKE94887.1 AraC-like DNA-binding protein [Ichthyenterobacterium magnum]
MYFKRYTPKHFFSRFIDCFFVIDTSVLDINVEDLVIPDGTFGLLFIEDQTQAAISRTLSTNSESFALKKTTIFGQKTHAVNYNIKAVKSIVFGLKIKPNGMFLFTPDVFNLKNIFTDITTINNDNLLILEQKILDSHTIKQKIDCVEEYISQRLKVVEFDSDFEFMESIVDFIHNHKGNVKFNYLLECFGANYKKIERLFLKYLGVTPKVYMRIIRFNACINSYQNTDLEENLTQLALVNGFFDQSHLIKEFKQFTSLTPKQFFNKELSYSENEYMNIINNRW